MITPKVDSLWNEANRTGDDDGDGSLTQRIIVGIVTCPTRLAEWCNQIALRNSRVLTRSI